MSQEIQRKFMEITERCVDEMLQIECSTTQRDAGLRAAMRRISAELTTRQRGDG